MCEAWSLIQDSCVRLSCASAIKPEFLRVNLSCVIYSDTVLLEFSELVGHKAHLVGQDNEHAEGEFLRSPVRCSFCASHRCRAVGVQETALLPALIDRSLVLSCVPVLPLTDGAAAADSSAVSAHRCQTVLWEPVSEPVTR